MLPIRFINHFQLLSASIYLLLQENLTQTDISLAESNLIKFANQFEVLYGKKNIVMCVHLVRHMGIAVRHLGPLWAQSTFAFETNNGKLVHSNQSKNHYLHQIAWKYLMKNELIPPTKNPDEILIMEKSNGKGTILSLTPEDVKK